MCTKQNHVQQVPFVWHSIVKIWLYFFTAAQAAQIDQLMLFK